MKLILILFVACFSLSFSFAQPSPPQRTVTITIDDLPVVTRRRTPEVYREITEHLVTSLKDNEVPAIGFVNEVKLYKSDRLDTLQTGLLKKWLAAGLELGNHTYSHPSLHNISLTEYQQEIIKGEKITRQISQPYGKAPTYFRHPFLHTGLNVPTRDSLLVFLDEHGYQVAPVSIDNADYWFALAYERTLIDQDEAMQQKVRDTYLDYMEEYFAYFEQQSQALLGREIAQILLLHANALNADTFDRLAQMIRDRGYTFVSLATALEDKAYTTQKDTFTGKSGISWIHRWAHTQGKPSDFFQGEPQVPEFINQLAESF